MPGPVIGADQLDALAAPPHQEVGRYPQCCQLAKFSVRMFIQLIGKQTKNSVAAEAARRQADVVHDQQIDLGALRTCVEIGRRQTTCA